MLLDEILNIIWSLRKTSIEIYEWKEADVRMPRLPNAPDFRLLTTKRPNLFFNGWDLAHAIVKADYLDKRNLTMPGIGFLLHASNIIDFSKSQIALKDDASKALNDFSLTSLGGRVGQGLAILYGHHLGLRFSAHLRTHVESFPAGSPAATHKGKAMADFLFANNNKTVLIESKGSFTQKKNDPTTIKSVLKEALTKQVDPWMNYLQPPPSNGYVVYSCLRENSWSPSSLSVVDPSGDDGELADVPFSSEEVMRENYGAWLRAMGLPQAAERLKRMPGLTTENGFELQPVETGFWIYEYGGRKFATVDKPFGWSFPSFNVGIDLTVLMAISKSIETPKQSLAEQLANISIQVDIPQELASIFPDGSFFGMAYKAPSDFHRIRL